MHESSSWDQQLDVWWTTKLEDISGRDNVKKELSSINLLSIYLCEIAWQSNDQMHKGGCDYTPIIHCKLTEYKLMQIIFIKII